MPLLLTQLQPMLSADPETLTASGFRAKRALAMNPAALMYHAVLMTAVPEKWCKVPPLMLKPVSKSSPNACGTLPLPFHSQ